MSNKLYKIRHSDFSIIDYNILHKRDVYLKVHILSKPKLIAKMQIFRLKSIDPSCK